MFFKKYKKQIIILLCVMLIASTMGMVIAYLLSEQMVGITNQNVRMMVQFTLLILAAVFVHHVCWFFWSKFAAVIANKVACDIKTKIISQTLNTKTTQIKSHTAGYYLERLSLMRKR